MKKSSSKTKTIKKIFNFLWIAGTCVTIISILIALSVNIYLMYTKDKKASVLANLSKYNSQKFGYVAGEQDTIKYRDISPVVTPEFRDALVNIEANEVRILKPYNLVSVLIDEPIDDIEVIESIVKDYADFWHIVKEGVDYYGTPSDGTISEEDITLIEYNSTTVDNFISSFDETINTATGLVMFVDYDYAQVPVFDKLCTELSNVIINADDADKLIVELTVISEIGDYTNNLNYLYSLVEKIK